MLFERAGRSAVVHRAEHRHKSLLDSGGGLLLDRLIFRSVQHRLVAPSEAWCLGGVTNATSYQLPPVTSIPSDGLRDRVMNHARDRVMNHAPVVEPLVQALLEARVSCWYDKAEIKWGDSLSGKIDEGLANSAYVIVVLSKDSLEKSWPMSELNASMSREVREGKVRVLPLMVGTPGEIELIQGRLPLQSHKLYQVWTGDPVPVVEALKSRLGR
ncbi:MAG: toll/interleukin-1 receptor domain-containing protein [Myxococcales bacterium]|nr:toll/interleukin-1 receptor domain-containing protein [Myxococcales bacterium]